MSIAKVASLYQGSTDGNPFTTGTIDTTGVTCLFVMLSAEDTNSLTVTDSASNNYTGAPTFDDSQGIFHYKIWIVYNPNTSTTHSWTTAGAAFAPTVCVFAASGTALSGPPAQSSTNKGAAINSLQPGSITPAEASDLLITWWTGSDGPTIDAPFTPVDGIVTVTGAHAGGALAYEIQAPGPTARNPTWTVGFSSTIVVGMVVIKGPAATGVTWLPVTRVVQGATFDAIPSGFTPPR